EDARADLLEELIAGRVAKGVVDLFEVVQVDEQEREHSSLFHLPPIEVARKDLVEPASIAQARQLIGYRLPLALDRDGAQAPERESEPEPGHEQRRGRKCDGDGARAAQAREQQYRKRRCGSGSREQESRGPRLGEWIRP